MEIRNQGRTFGLTALAGLVCAALVTAAGPLPPQDAIAWEEHEPAGCRKEARTRFYSCRLESLEDYNLNYANCDTLDGDSRGNCRHDARTALNEANKKCEDQFDQRLEYCSLPAKDI